jgi:hypothetical protein
VSGEIQPGELARRNQELNTTAVSMDLSEQTVHKVVLTESPLETTLEGTEKHDLVVMSLGDSGIDSHACSGILMDDFARRIDCSVLLVRGDLRPHSSDRPEFDNHT